MEQKNSIQVVIGGKILTMSGSEDEMHIQRVAACVNRKLQEMEETNVYRSLPTDLKPLLIELNIAEDLIEAQDTIAMLESDLKMKENELAEVKQRLVETEMKLDRLEGRKKR